MDTLISNNMPPPWPVDSRVRKVKHYSGDTHPVGAEGTIVGYYGPCMCGARPVHGYIILFDGDPRHFLMFSEGRLELINDGNVERDRAAPKRADKSDKTYN